MRDILGATYRTTETKGHGVLGRREEGRAGVTAVVCLVGTVRRGQGRL